MGVIDDYAQWDGLIYRHCNYLTESASGRFSVQVLVIFYIINTEKWGPWEPLISLWSITRQGTKKVVLPFQSNIGLFCFPKSFIMCTTVSSGHWTRSYNLQSQTNTSETQLLTDLISSQIFLKHCSLILDIWNLFFVEIVFC